MSESEFYSCRFCIVQERPVLPLFWLRTIGWIDRPRRRAMRASFNASSRSVYYRIES